MKKLILFFSFCMLLFALTGCESFMQGMAYGMGQQNRMYNSFGGSGFIYDPAVSNAATGMANTALQNMAAPTTFTYTPGQSTSYDSSSSSSYSGSSSNSNSGSTATSSSSKSKGHKCRVCSGTGEVISEVWMGSSPDKWCDKCKKEVYSTHTHKVCKTCGGTGWISDY